MGHRDVEFRQELFALELMNLHLLVSGILKPTLPCGIGEPFGG
jgi:hypothetical protein